jgi:hypothetical protein
VLELVALLSEPEALPESVELLVLDGVLLDEGVVLELALP